jgi:hypothetical protein
MNKWAKESLALVTTSNYLDELHVVYPMEQNQIRQIDEGVRSKISQAHERGDELELLKLCLKHLDLFPIKDSYVAFLKKKGGIYLEPNPETVHRIGGKLMDMGPDAIFASSTQPKETNRQIGPLFKRWLSTLGYPVLSRQEFIKFEGIAFLEGTDSTLTAFANEYLGTQLTRGLDIIVKINAQYIIGEAKFLTDNGGHQTGQFLEAMDLLHSQHGAVTKIAVLDGVVWIPGNNRMHQRTINEPGIVLTALLLPQLIQEFSAL